MRGERSLAAAAPRKSIAVMPLVNISRDTSDAYFAAGMTAELTNALSRIHGLRVASGTESAARDQAASPTDIGKSLNVNMVLVGTVQRDKTRLRVTARLVNTADGFTVWSDMFERDVEGRVQGAGRDLERDRRRDLAGAVAAGADRGRAATPRSRGALAVARAHGTTDLQAYDLYLRGRYFFEKRGEDGPSPRARLLPAGGAEGPDVRAGVRRHRQRVRGAAALRERARRLGDAARRWRRSTAPSRSTARCAEAYASRATLLQAGWRWTDAERDYQRALALDPNYAAAHQWYGELLLAQRPHDRGAGAAQARDASSIRCRRSRSGRTRLALAVGATPGFGDRRGDVARWSWTRRSRHAIHARHGVPPGRSHCPTATRELEAATRLDSTSVQALGLLGYAYAKIWQHGARDRDRARRLEIEIGEGERRGARPRRASTSGWATERARSTLLERAAADHDLFFSSESLAERFFDPIRGNPRFSALLKRIGIDDRVALKQ